MELADYATLRQIGLSESEIKVYFALLELESSTVGPIIDKAKVPDSKIYSIMEKLKEKGLASFVVKNKVKHFQASDPRALVRLLDEKQQAIESQKQELIETILPQIELQRTLTQDKQEAVVYESLAGLKAAFLYMLDCLGKGDEYQVFVLPTGLGTKQVLSFFREHHKRRLARGIGVRLISNAEHREALKQHLFVLEHVRYTTMKFPVGLYLFKGHVMTVLWGERKTAFVIKSQANYQTYKEFFEDLWKKSN